MKEIEYKNKKIKLPFPDADYILGLSPGPSRIVKPDMAPRGACW